MFLSPKKYCLFLLLFWTIISVDCWAGNYKIAIDIGHSRNIPGAISARGKSEYLFNKSVATLLFNKLQQDNRFKESFIINETGEDISLFERASMANLRKAHLFISIHHDSVYPKDLSEWVFQGKIMPHCDKYMGHSIFYSEKNGSPTNSLKFAYILGTEMLNAGFCPTLHHAEKFIGGDKDLIHKIRGIYKYNNLVVLKETEIPAVLFECGIIKNRNEELLLCDIKYQQKIVAAIIKAINIYFK